MKKWIWISGLVVFMIAGVLALSPFYSVYQIKKGISEKDREKLEHFVLFSELRENLKSQLDETFENRLGKKNDEKEGRFSGFALKFAKKFANHMVDAYVTPEGLSKLMGGETKKDAPKGETFPRESGDTQTSPSSGSKPASPLEISSEEKLKLLKNARFAYSSPSRFIITMPTKNDKEIRFILRREGLVWKLNNIILPLSKK